MMLLAASPGAPFSAIYTHLARGDLALCLILAAVTSVVAFVSLPVIVNISLPAFYGEASTARLEPRQVLQVFVIAIVPALVGVFVYSRLPGSRLPGDGASPRPAGQGSGDALFDRGGPGALIGQC